MKKEFEKKNKLSKEQPNRVIGDYSLANRKWKVLKDLHASTTQQNSIAEQKNCTIFVMTGSMLKCKYLLNTYWIETIDCIVYLLNYCLTNNIKLKMPLELWSNIKLNVNHLKVFGYIAYAHISEQRKKKSDDQGKRCILIWEENESIETLQSKYQEEDYLKKSALQWRRLLDM